jgi:hypothetical protein
MSGEIFGEPHSHLCGATSRFLVLPTNREQRADDREAGKRGPRHSMTPSTPAQSAELAAHTGIEPDFGRSRRCAILP